jgi:hypothetical protein
MMTKQYKVLGLVVYLAATAAFVTGTSAQAQAPTDLCNDAYLAYMKTTISDLNGLYLKSKDEKVSQGEAEVARQGAFRKAREAFAYMDKRFDSMNIDEGAALCPQELLMDIHLMTMMMDMVATEHLPHEDRWSYTD